MTQEMRSDDHSFTDEAPTTPDGVIVLTDADLVEVPGWMLRLEEMLDGTVAR